MPEKPYGVGITGHRHFSDTAVSDFVRRKVERALLELKERYEAVTAFSALAAGADTIFAEVALDLRLRLEAVIPFANYEQDFRPGASRERYVRLKKKAAVLHELPAKRRSNEAYLACGHWLVQHCDLLIAAWDGKPAKGLGGTADIVDYALQLSRPVLHLHTLEQEVKQIERR